MATINERGELNTRRPSERADRIQRRPGSAARKKNIIDDDDGATFQWQRKFRRMHHWQLGACTDVVAMHRHVDRALFDVDLSDLANEFGETARDLYSAQRNSREHDRFELGVLLDDLMRDPTQRALDRFPVHDRGLSRSRCSSFTGFMFLVVHLHPSRPRRIALKAHKI